MSPDVPPRTARRTTDRQPTIVCAPKDASCCRISRNTYSNHDTLTELARSSYSSESSLAQDATRSLQPHDSPPSTSGFSTTTTGQNNSSTRTPKTRSYEAPSSSIMSTEAMAVPAPEGEPVGLHSPPDSNSAPKDLGSDSELSDLEPEFDTDELVGIEPEYISDGGVPVFRPSMEEFADFQRYMRAVNPYGMRSGIVKVIPPLEWVAAQPRLDDAVKTIKVKEPIIQDIMGTSGTYRQANIVHQRSYNLPQWRQLCNQSDHQPPAKRGERRANQEVPKVKAAPKPKSSGTSTPGGSKKKGSGRQAKGKKSAAKDEGTATPDRLPTPVSPTLKAEEDTESIKQEMDDEDEEPRPKGGRQPKAISVSSRRKNNRREAAGKIDEAAFKDFKYELEGEDYSPERCEELERAYWKTLTYAPPLYGADMPGTLFDDRTTTWNLGKLENLLDVLGTKIPGVNTAYLYLGMWKATFAWHLEDVDLYSINYLHFGAPKQWYSISQGDARRFEAAMKSIWPTDAKACDQFLRHKTFLISPAHLLSNYNIKVNKIVHNPGEFVITFPYGYHSGYNLGYNCAEAVNFALDSWLEYGRVAKKCDCSEAQDSVWIDVHEIERKLRGEETEYEETDDEEEEEDDEENDPTDLPTPPESSGEVKTKTKSPKKRKRPTDDKGDKLNIKRIRVRIKAPSREPCILCPNDIPSEPLLPTEDGQKAHRICALYIPETSIESGERELVTDIKYIDKARLELKCNYCRSKKGACFQCSQKKCTRAYHATCAAAAGVLVEQGEIPVFGEDGTEYKEWGIEFSCRFHRSKRDKKLDSDALDDNKRILKAASELKIGEVCQMQYYRGDIFAGAIVENRKSEEMVLVDILPRGERVEVEYKWLLIPDPADYHLPKPSANAIPMPKSRKDKQSLNTSKRQADDLPRADDPFVEGCTWAEFKNENIARNLYQVKIDFTKENQIWFYLGKTSTEAKAQFTEDPAKPRHNPKGHFLDTIPKPAPAAPRQSYAASYPSTVSQNTLNALNALKASGRPYQPGLQAQLQTPSSNRPEKPYVYKPRTTAVESYRVDTQAYRSQQNFLHRTAPYSFGTDPRWTPADSSSPKPYTAPSSSSKTPSSMGAMAPPHTQYRPTYAPTTYNPPIPAKPSNPFSSGRARPSQQSPFAKYSYLQKEHNRSPLEYKSPYRPGGGFMNGYQGNIEKHLQQTLFRNRPGSSTPFSNPLPSYGSSMRTSYSPGQPSPNPTFSSPSTYSAYTTPTTSQQSPLPTPPKSNASTPNTWEKKDPSQMHPAIRPEYNSMFNHQYQPPRPSPSQFRGPVMQPPAMYNYANSPAQPYTQYQPSQIPQSQAPQYSQSQTRDPPNAHPAEPSPGVQKAGPFPVPQPQYQSQAVTQPAIAPQSQYQPASAATRPSHPPLPQPQYQPPTLTQPSQLPSSQTQHQAPSTIPQPAYPSGLQPSFQSTQAAYQEQKPLYPHQQYFQTHQAGTQPLQTKPMVIQPRDFPDVPVDSTSLIEKMMKNLKKVAPSATSPH